MKILITGATGGIGEELVKYLSLKHQIIALSRSQQNLDQLKTHIKNSNFTVLAANVGDKKQIKKVFSTIKSIDVLINCAAVLKPVGLFLDNDLNQWKENIETNLLGSVYMCYYALPYLLQSRRGKIINFAGGGSAYPRQYHTAYGTSKTAVVRFSETLATEYPDIDINSIAPGAYKTKMWQEETYDQEPKDWGDMERLKKFIDFLISKKSDKLTGKFIHYKDKWENFKLQKLSKNIYTLKRIEK